MKNTQQKGFSQKMIDIGRGKTDHALKPSNWKYNRSTKLISYKIYIRSYYMNTVYKMLYI